MKEYRAVNILPRTKSPSNPCHFNRYCNRSELFGRKFVLAGLLLLACMPAFAGLGEDASSVEADQAHVQGRLQTRSSQAYTVHEIQDPTGTVVREYVSASGKVFAVAWQGPWPPDLRQVLSGYFAEFQQAAQASAQTGRKPIVIEHPGFVMHAGGHMRFFAGRAYVPSMLPQGVSAEELR